MYSNHNINANECNGEERVDIDYKFSDCGAKHLAANTKCCRQTPQSIDAIVNNHECNGVDIENKDNAYDQQNVSANPPSLQQIDAIAGVEPNPVDVNAVLMIDPNIVINEGVYEQNNIDLLDNSSARRPPPHGIDVGVDLIDIMLCDHKIECRGCLSCFVKNLDFLLIFPLNMFLSFYHMIAVANFDSYCLDCKTKSVVFGTLNFTLNGHQYFASDVTHWSICFVVIVSTILCAMLLFVWREWLVTLIYGVVILLLSIFCFVIRIYFLGIYSSIVSIVLLIIAGLRFSNVNVIDNHRWSGWGSALHRASDGSNIILDRDYNRRALNRGR